MALFDDKTLRREFRKVDPEGKGVISKRLGCHLLFLCVHGNRINPALYEKQRYKGR